MILEVIVAVAIGMLLHELAHAYVGHWLGDPTPAAAGRLTFNPAAHIDVIGSVAVPLCVFMLFGWVIGWGRSVPLVRAWYTTGGWITVLVVGPAANLFVALVCLQLGYMSGASANLMLAGFNLLPIPPLDGWRAVRRLNG